mmetsp:Transcript_77849/g.142477  ORF Transcript_77849/g.142477 Transcript_77849/m.142477 type:complete len:319 (-) Transcript_77849:36-992(-)
MRVLLLVLACWAHHADAQNMDAQDQRSALAALLLAVNPSLSQMSSRARGVHRTTGRHDQTTIDDSKRALRSAIPPMAEPASVVKRTVLQMRGGSNVPDETWASLQPIRVQGGELETWSFKDTKRLVVAISGDDESLTSFKDEGRDLNVAISLCEGPNKTPFQVKINSQKGVCRPFKGIIETPGKHSSLFIRNIGQIEFPITAGVAAQTPEAPAELAPASVYEMADPYLLQGNSVKIYPLDKEVKQVKVQLSTQGRPLYAKIELLRGPNEVRYEMDVYSEDGKEWPFFTITEIPGSDYSIRVVNTASWEFPLKVDVQPL